MIGEEWLVNHEVVKTTFYKEAVEYAVTITGKKVVIAAHSLW